ncbi:hypothetical protein [Desulfosediminicola ganghwensis]|uniref:hypothetical protein n=1 Tax=Desulfosediminicola ganghwensis TaxID=2569540 RepID=UPI0010AD0203|nr:hypothetical protein [Desulfosediminicola ganghwensis]
MSTPGRRRHTTPNDNMMPFLVMLFCSLHFFLFGAAVALAESQESCENGSVSACMSDILDQEDEMIDQADDMLKEMESAGIFAVIRVQTGVNPQPELIDRIETLRNDNRRAREMNATATDEDYDEMLSKADKEQGKNCKDSDLLYYESLVDDNYLPPGYSWVDTGNGKDKFGNGKCDVFSATDLYGEDVWVNEREANMCDQVCNDKTDGNGVSRKGQNKERFVGSLKDAISSKRAANVVLAQQRAMISELGAMLAAMPVTQDDYQPPAPADDPCDNVTTDPVSDHLIAEQVLQITITSLDAVVIVTNVGIEVLETISDVAHDTCAQDAMGFNARAACSPMTIAFHVAKGLNDVFKGVITILSDAKEITALSGEMAKSYQADDSKACSKQIWNQFNTSEGKKGKVVVLQEDVNLLKSDISELRTSSGNTNTQLLDLEDQLAAIKKYMEDNRTLLLVPEGQRSKIVFDQ